MERSGEWDSPGGLRPVLESIQPGAGLIYADTRSMKEAFSRSTMNAVLSAARRLERTLYGGAIPGISHRGPIWDETPKLSEPLSETGISLGLRRQAPRPKAVAPVASPSVQQLDLGKLGRPNERSLVVFLRSLSTLINAGISIHRALAILGQHESDLALRQTCQFLAARVSGGNNLSSSMSQCPQLLGNSQPVQSVAPQLRSPNSGW